MKNTQKKNENTLSNSIKRDFTKDVEVMRSEVPVGEVLTYPQLCKFFNLETCKGKQRTVQLNEMQRYVELEKDGSKYIIVKYYNEPLPKVNGNSKYSNFIQYILLDYLKRLPNQEAAHTKREWYEILGCTNKNYNTYYKKSSELKEKIDFKENNDDIEVSHIDNYFDITYQALRTVFKNALDSLKKKSLIHYNNVYYITEDYGRLIREATDSEVSDILTLQKETMNDFNVVSLPQIFFKKDENKQPIFKPFFISLNNRFKKKFGKDKSYYNMVKVYTVSTPHLENEQNRILKNIDINEYKELLNDASIKRINSYTDKEYNTELEELSELGLVDDNDEELKKNIINNKIQREICRVLNDNLISLDADIL